MPHTYESVLVHKYQFVHKKYMYVYVCRYLEKHPSSHRKVTAV